MPGLVGFTHVAGDQANPEQVLRKMQDMITHHEFYRRDELFCNGSLYATRSRLPFVEQTAQPYQKDGIYIWLDGEFYNQEELSTRPTAPSSDPEILHALLKQREDFTPLKQIDGCFSAVVYDSINQRVQLVADRYGLKPLYWTVHKGDLAWGSEGKALLALPGFEPKIDPHAVQEFFSFGYLLNDRTWFEGVELLSPATVLTWDIRQQSIRRQCYWSWDEIRPLSGRIDEGEIAKELGRLFVDAVRRRSREGERVGLMLSGGLDSRAILAAMPRRAYPIHTVTYGKKGCDDIRIATMAVKVKGAAHKIVEINGENWLTPRVYGVWWTDGLKNLMHMHDLDAFSKIRELFDISLDGYLGDATIGGSYLNDPQSNEIDKIRNRGRRFILLGPKLAEVYVKERFPFFDNKFLGLTIAIPARLRAGSWMYNKMLLEAFPAFFRAIPWQRTGMPVSSAASIVKGVLLLRTAKNRLVKRLTRFGLHYSDSKDYTDYPKWIRQEPARSFFERVLTNVSAIYPEYISEERVHEEWKGHLQGDDHAESLCRYLTFEIWLQQVFEGGYRPTGV